MKGTERMKNLALWMRWAVAAATLALALLLCWQCIDLYVDGNSADNLDANGVHITSVYSADRVGERLRSLAVPAGAYVLLCIAALAAQAGRTAEKEKNSITPENRLRLMKKRVAKLPEAAEREEKLRCGVLATSGAAIGVCGALCLGYLLDGANFVSWELEGVMGQMLLHVVPWVMLAFAAGCAASVVCGRSVLRECEALRGAASGGTPCGTQETCRTSIVVMRAVLLAAAIVFIVLGVMNGGVYDVLVKAINICTECIGLG